MSARTSGAFVARAPVATVVGRAAARSGDLEVRIADDPALIDQAFDLRYRVFHRELGARGDGAAQLGGRDVDGFDRDCDHLIALDRARPEGPKVVGVYRLRRGRVANGGFYSAGEFDLAPLARLEGEALELGRSCVDPEYRTAPVLPLLWRGLGAYVERHRIDLMFGCASFHGVDPACHAEPFALLARRFRAPAALRPRALPGARIELDPDPERPIDEAAARLALPPLIKGYLRAGGMIGDGAVIDRAFNTIDVCVVLPTASLQERYRRRFAAGGR